MVFEDSKKPGVLQDDEQLSEPDRLGGGRGRVNPPLGACFGGLGGLEGLTVIPATCLEAHGLGGLISLRDSRRGYSRQQNKGLKNMLFW